MRRLGLALALLLPFAATRAGTELPITLESGAQARIRVGSCFNFLPPAGYAPIDVKIDNHSAEAQTWRFDFKAPAFTYGFSYSVSSQAQFTVPPKAARSFRLVVPLGLDEIAYASPLEIRVAGYGTDQTSSASFPVATRTGKELTTFVGASEAIASRHGSQLEEEIKAGNQQLASVTFPAVELPEDWRVLAGLAAIWMTQTEIDQLAAGQREALHNWVHRGGRLFVVGAASTTYPLPEVGFGKVIVLPKPELDVPATAEAIRALKPSFVRQLSQDYTRANAMWEARRAVGELEVNVPLLVGFMALFAAISGPANLFFFAPAGRRHRLFWTTPAISVVASVVLALLIIFQDGFGGTGHRLALVHLIPAERKQVVLQEQIARTGVLRSSEFTAAEPVFIAPISLEIGPYGRSYQTSNVDRHFGGWFKSRSLQAQWLESVTSSRAEVAVLNAAELHVEGVAPVILSSINAPLDELYYFDQRGGAWRAANVRAGEKVTLERSSAGVLLGDEGGPRLRSAWENVWQKPGHFYAASSAPGPLIETLPSIRWEHQRVVYFGAVSTAPPPP